MEGHEMSIRQASGNCEVWNCPECERVLIIDWKRIDSNPIVVLKRGNDAIVHYGGKGGLAVNDVEVSPNAGLTDEDRLWIASHDIDWNE